MGGGDQRPSRGIRRADRHLAARGKLFKDGLRRPGLPPDGAARFRPRRRARQARPRSHPAARGSGCQPLPHPALRSVCAPVEPGGAVALPAGGPAAGRGDRARHRERGLRHAFLPHGRVVDSPGAVLPERPGGPPARRQHHGLRAAGRVPRAVGPPGRRPPPREDRQHELPAPHATAGAARGLRVLRPPRPHDPDRPAALRRAAPDEVRRGGTAGGGDGAAGARPSVQHPGELPQRGIPPGPQQAASEPAPPRARRVDRGGEPRGAAREPRPRDQAARRRLRPAVGGPARPPLLHGLVQRPRRSASAGCTAGGGSR